MKTRYEELQKKLHDAIRKRDYCKQSIIMNELKKLEDIKREENISLKNLAIENLTVDEHYEAICLMNKMFIFTDILETAALEFNEFLKDRIKNIDMPIINKTVELAKNARSIVRIVDECNDPEMSDQFGDLCDKIRCMAMNMIYSEEAKLKQKIKNEHLKYGKD